ncbi:MAG: stage II sporulation protein M [Streptococcaceae bacterium]|jgi:uncharacterized membrane protein SpoIIM required for sporulation|nr:stage II sporulation protein M [Streptococcaceae bacterium]
MENLLHRVKNKPFLLSFLWALVIASIFFLLGINISGLTADLHVQKLGFQEIFIHNLLLSLILLVSVITFGLISNILLSFNFLMLGIKVRALQDTYGFEVIINKVLRHGVFEIPQILLAGSFGLYFLTRKLTKQPIRIDRDFVFLTLKILLICLILNLISAYVEVNFSMKG